MREHIDVDSVNITLEVFVHCLILNGNQARSSFDAYLTAVASGLGVAGHSVRRFDLRDLDVRSCTGCWSGWWKTPGLCAISDGMSAIYPELVRADLVVWASPPVLGTISALLKRAQDRFIPIAHPYIEVVDGECHHRHRYARNADLGLIVEPQPDDTDDDVALTRRLFERFSRNTRTRLRFSATPATPIAEVLHAALAA
jgi:hypothetical protein